MLRVGSLFSGIGMLDLAVERTLDCKTIWFAELDTTAGLVLSKHWPGIINYRDVRRIDWAKLPAVDILTGGFPCQDVSVAGSRKGLRSGTRSGLWSYMAEAISVLRPKLVVIENVKGLLNAHAHTEVEPCAHCMGDRSEVWLRALGAVLGDLADIRYDAVWTSATAGGIGTPHLRPRVFVLAWPSLVNAPGEGLPEYWSERTKPSQWGTATIRPAIAAEPPWREFTAVIRRWEDILGRPAPYPVQYGPRGGYEQITAELVEWMMGMPEGWVTSVRGIRRDKAVQFCGASVVPQQAESALRSLLQMIDNHRRTHERTSTSTGVTADS
jgi:DNA (cytosine-5)-methyltransferase 1